MGQSSSNSRRRGDYQQTHPPHAPPPRPPFPPPNPYYSYPQPAAVPPPPAPYYHAYRPRQSGGYGGLMSFLDSLIENSYPSSYRPNHGSIWWTSSAPPPAPLPYHSFSEASTSTAVAPPPYVEHQKAKKIKNDVNLHKDTIRMEVDEQNPDQFLVSFVYDAVVEGSITVYYFAKEGLNCTFSSIYEDFYKTNTAQFEKGTGKRFCQPSGTGIDLGFMELDDLSKTLNGDVFPLVIYAEASQPTVSNDQAGKSTSTRAQITLAVIEKSSNGGFQAKAIKQILWIDGERYELQEIFGLENSSKEQVAIGGDEDMGKECVICMEEPRNTAVFPCRHLCMCSDCAKSFRLQSNKCPICRQPAEKLMEINVQNSD